MLFDIVNLFFSRGRFRVGFGFRLAVMPRTDLGIHVVPPPPPVFAGRRILSGKIGFVS